MNALVFVGIAVIVVVAIYVSYYLKQKRRSELQTVARQLGLEYSEEDVCGLLAYPFELFKRGDGRGCENVLAGQWQALDLKEFDYWYYEQSSDGRGGTSRTYYRFSCVLVPIQAACDYLTITHETMFSRIADHLGFEDIQFELEDFNRAFRVKCKDRKFANDMIDQRMMQWMLSMGERFGYEIMGNEVLVFAKKLDPLGLVPLLGTAKGFLDHVPRVVYELYPLQAKG